jgi:hypothetical protein
MDEAEAEKPIDEMSFHELRQEISQRTTRHDFTVDASSGRATVVALPIDEARPVVMRAGDRPEDVLRAVLRVLRGYGSPPAPQPLRRGGETWR